MPVAPLPLHSRCLVMSGSKLEVARVLMTHDLLKPFRVNARDGAIPTSSPQAAQFPPELLTVDCLYAKFSETGELKWILAEQAVPFEKLYVAHKRQLEESANRLPKVTRNRAKQRSAVSREALQAPDLLKGLLPVLAQLVELKPEFQIMVTIPDGVKRHLMRDYARVSHGKHLPRLPARVTVTATLAAYGERAGCTGDLLDGLREYFNRLVGPLLLYDFERQQYARLDLGEGDSYADIYGVTHLMRMLVVMPCLLASSLLTDDALKIILHTSTGLLQYLEDTNDSFHHTQDLYVEPSLTYLRENSRYC